MKTISTKTGRNIIVDDDDYSILMEFRWFIATKRYAARMVKNGDKRAIIYLHRQIMNPKIGMVVDHINGDTLDNRRCNLRVCTQSDNLANQKIGKRNTSGAKGISFDKNRNKWVAQTHKNGKHIFIGRYFSKEEAIAAHSNIFQKIHNLPV